MHRLVTAATTRNQADFTFHRSIFARDENRVVVDAKAISVSRLHPLEGLANDFLWGVEELLHRTSMNLWHLPTSFCVMQTKFGVEVLRIFSAGATPRGDASAKRWFALTSGNHS